MDTIHIQSPAKSSQDLARLMDKYDHLSADTRQRSLHLLASLQKKEERLRRQLSSKDSAAAVRIFWGSTAIYQQLEGHVNKTSSTLPLHPLKDYLPGVDSIQTALRFLKGYQLPIGMQAQLQSTEDKLLSLQEQLQQANNLSAFVQQRQQRLQAQLQAYNLGDRLISYKKQAYYYKEQVEHGKELLHDPERISARILSIVRNLPSFQKYFLRHSYLSTLFRLPGSDSEEAGQPIPGLQTRGEVEAAAAERLGPGINIGAMVTTGGNIAGPDAAGINNARDQLNSLKDKLAGGNSNTGTAEFRANPQHNKTFFQRIQLGFDVQTQSSTNLVPALSNLGLSAGYLLNSRSIMGIGAGYKLGWGQPFDHIAFSSQGASVRSFVDWRITGGLWLAGGYETSYYSAFAHLSQLRSISAWQSSMLLGLMKQYKAGKRTGNMQLLFDILYGQHIPRSQPVFFRMGYSFH